MEKKNICWSRTVLLLLLLGMIALAPMLSCRGKKPDAEEKELVVLCGSSFPKPMEQLCSEFTAQTGVKFAMTVAGSENHLPLIKTAQMGDIFVTHDPYLNYVADANALLDSAHVGFVCPVVAVQAGNPKGVSNIDDLAKPGLKVALSNPEYSTCGEMVFALLEKKGIKDAVMKNVENRLTKGHSELGTFLKTKTVDAVIMWNGVAHTFRESVDVVRTPYEYDKEIRVHIIGLSYTKQPESVKKFIEFARAKGPNIFADYGYVK
jgi:molybdate transport system substrate-binding protein